MKGMKITPILVSQSTRNNFSIDDEEAEDGEWREKQ